MTDRTLAITLPAPYDETVDRVREALADAGFGVLTEIDLKATLHAKLGVDVTPRLILGACRPQLAYRALEADPRVATLLPCNVVVAAQDEGTRVEVFDPALIEQFSDDPEIAVVAGEARVRLSAMMEALRLEGKDRDASRA